MPRPFSTIPLALLLASSAVAAQTPTLPPLPPPVGIPKPGPVGDAPYAPQPILPGGVVVPLYPPGSPFLKAEPRARGRGLQPEPDGAGPDQQHRQHPQPVDRVPSGRSLPQHRRSGDPRRRRRPQLAQRRQRERGLRSLLLPVRREHRHPAQSPAPRWVRRPDRCGVRRAAGDQGRARIREAVERRPEQDRHHRLLGGRRAVRAVGAVVRRVRPEERAGRTIHSPA